jgi:hypothetical protein
MNKHTPGPWKVDDREDRDDLYISTVKELGRGQWSRFASVVRGWPEMEDADGTANARLIAAAPDLLDALERMVSAGSAAAASPLDPQGRLADVMAELKQARAAIKKAKGE